MYTDSAAAYAGAARARGVHHATVNHHIGQFARHQWLCGRQRLVGTQGLDGTWGLLRHFLRKHGNPSSDTLDAHIDQGPVGVRALRAPDEFVWRRNLRGADPFLALLQVIADGHWQ